MTIFKARLLYKTEFRTLDMVLLDFDSNFDIAIR